ncbi:hypothetical protein VA596_43490 [Amycolatopsis sp., V23-08]|uniref:Uncharacterized protein n=1 Tax=Amycolatopsis heterodermiae TaxID=3110235 RepID=A0ABU5RJJ5_9PSEU|nr:hypothetical protein [Amycolatopsis sp., V23-08]MEA5366458.1 hypothetical protein [Amycolatopsis sp., V23-08]
MKKMNVGDERNPGSSEEGEESEMVDLLGAVRGYSRAGERQKSSPAGLISEEARDPGYYISPGNWNVHATAETVAVEGIYEVLSTFDDLYEPAMKGLARVGSTDASDLER